MSEFKPEYTCVTGLEITGQILFIKDGGVVGNKAIKEVISLTEMDKAHGMLDAIRKAWEQAEMDASQELSKPPVSELEAEIERLKAELQSKTVEEIKAVPLSVNEVEPKEFIGDSFDAPHVRYDKKK